MLLLTSKGKTNKKMNLIFMAKSSLNYLTFQSPKKWFKDRPYIMNII